MMVDVYVELLAGPGDSVNLQKNWPYKKTNPSSGTTRGPPESAWQASIFPSMYPAHTTLEVIAKVLEVKWN